jgi:dolichol-phosphate mannosyltransferase
MFISVVIPVYRAESMMDELIQRIETSLSKITTDFEIVLVEDCGPDNSWQKIVEISKQKKFIKGIKLSRNFGQHYAISAGLDSCSGEWVVVMDCDLQDQPEEIVKLYEKAKEGYHIVLAKRYNRQDTFFKRSGSKLFYFCLGYLTGTKQDATVANFGIYHHKVIKAIVNLPEKIRYFPTMVKWVGFSHTQVNVDHASRVEGKSNYNLKKLLNLALDIILAYSDKPLRLIVKFGMIISLLSFVFAIASVVAKFSGVYTVSGYASLIASIWFLSGCIIFTLGIVGLYVGKTFEGVKNRPSYIIEDTTYE